MPGPHSSFQTIGTAIPPPLPPRQPAQNYLGYNDYRPYGSSYGNYGNYGYGGGYRGYGGYGSFGNYIPYSGNSYGQFGGHSGDVENRYIIKKIIYKYLVCASIIKLSNIKENRDYKIFVQKISRNYNNYFMIYGIDPKVM